MPFIDENSVWVFPAALTDWLPLIKSNECEEVILAGGNREKENLWVPFIHSQLLRDHYMVLLAYHGQFLFYYGR